jgi:hypothetical protein
MEAQCASLQLHSQSHESFSHTNVYTQVLGIRFTVTITVSLFLEEFCHNHTHGQQSHHGAERDIVIHNTCVPRTTVRMHDLDEMEALEPAVTARSPPETGGVLPSVLLERRRRRTGAVEDDSGSGRLDRQGRSMSGRCLHRRSILAHIQAR